MIGLSDKTAPHTPVLKKTYSIGGKNITFETGKLALLAQGSVVISDDDGNMLLVTAGVKEEGVNQKADFFPMVVDYQEKFYATGKIGGNRFQKREGRPSDASILTSRLIDRPIRPMFPKGLVNDIQIIATALSSSNESDMGFLGITGASISLMLAGTPFEGPVSGVRVILKEDGGIVFDPKFEEEKEGKINIVVAGTLDAITMVEAGALEVSQDDFLKVLEYAHTLIKELCNAQIDFVNEARKVYTLPTAIKEVYNLPDETLFEKVQEFLSDEKLNCLYNLGKKEFQHMLDTLDEETKDFLLQGNYVSLEEGKTLEECKKDMTYVGEMVYKRVKKVMRKNVLEKELRLDGRKLNEVREVVGEVGLLPRTHGSALFRRGLTQALSITTLGGPDDIQLIDDMYEESTKRYVHHYNFPPFTVGEVRPLRGTGRREIGHGRLAERALEAVLPTEAEFPYMIRVVSECTTCNGSSSMASVCGSSMSLMQAGVPIKRPVAGVAMGMIYDEETGKYKILTDIQAQEDFLGDMDFKVAMTEKGITVMQLDVKIKGLPLQVFSNAFSQAREGIDYILGQMKQIVPTVNSELSPYAPRIEQITIPVDKIREVIGKGGENIQKMERDFEVTIHIEDDGRTAVTGKDAAKMKLVMEKLAEYNWEPNVGDKLTGECVNIIAGTGAIIEFKGRSGMIHISKLSPFRVANVEDIVKIGQEVEVEIIEINKEKGRIGLKRVVPAEEMARWEESRKPKETPKIAPASTEGELPTPKTEGSLPSGIHPDDTKI